MEHPSRSFDTQHLLLDAQTLLDLEVVKADEDAVTLFQFCNQTRTDGGARALKRRMLQPSCDPVVISDTQTAIEFIAAHRAVFEELPSSFAVNRTDHYMSDILPLNTHQNFLEFGATVVTLWANHERHYRSITLGVTFACALVRSLRRFVDQLDLETVPGELNPLLTEIHSLLHETGLHQVPVSEKFGVWKKLRLDQMFRVYEQSTIARVLQLTFEVDALVSLSDTTQTNGYVMPQIKTGPLSVNASDLVHPFLDEPVANDVALGEQNRILFLTGPNMAGKTTYLRSIATALYFAHLGMGVPARQFSFTPFQQLFSSISLRDDLRSGISYFRAEALRVKAIASAVAENKNVIAFLDEPFKGTNIKDAYDASLAILQGFASRPNGLFLFSSHLIELGEHLVDNQRFDCRYFEADASGDRLQFDYRLQQGMSDQRLGMRVLKEEGVFDLLS